MEKVAMRQNNGRIATFLCLVIMCSESASAVLKYLKLFAQLHIIVWHELRKG